MYKAKCERLSVSSLSRLREHGNFEASAQVNIWEYQDLPCTLNWGYMVPNSGFFGPHEG